jgi:FdhD protein
MREPITDVGIAAFEAGALSSRPDRVVTEEPLEIRLAGEALAVVMRTPGHDLELTAGFLLAEQIIVDGDDLGTIRHCQTGDDATEGNVVDVRLTPTRASQAAALLATRKAERSTVTSASCGVCGKMTIESLGASCPAFDKAPVLNPLSILPLPDRLRAAQKIFDATGGLHGAGIFDAAGELLVAREDVGRHNAVDKCIGALLLTERLPIKNATLVVSGRTSFEIIQKALIARVQTVVAVSAPSSLAVELAKSSNMALVGFTRGQSLNVYAGELA